MALSWKKCYLNIPLNNDGIAEHESFNLEMKNIFTIELSEAEYTLLIDIFYEMNKKFNIIIDIFEEEVLKNDNVADAIKLLSKHISESSNPDLIEAANKVMTALAKAKELNMPVYFDF